MSYWPREVHTRPTCVSAPHSKAVAKSPVVHKPYPTCRSHHHRSTLLEIQRHLDSVAVADAGSEEFVDVDAVGQSRHLGFLLQLGIRGC